MSAKKSATIHDVRGQSWTEHWSLHDGGPGVRPGDLMQFDEEIYIVTATNQETDEVWVREHPQADRIRRVFTDTLFYEGLPTKAPIHVAMLRAQLEHGRWLAEELAKAHPAANDVWGKL